MQTATVEGRGKLKKHVRCRGSRLARGVRQPSRRSGGQEAGKRLTAPG